MTILKSRMILPRTAELAALECLEKSQKTYNWAKWCFHFFSVVLDPILLILVGNVDMH